MSRRLQQVYYDTEHVLKERQGDISGTDVLKSLQDAMMFLFRQEDSRQDSGFEDRIGRCEMYTPEPMSSPNGDAVGDSVDGLGAHVYYNENR